uniref:Uncharacterized protein n=1 Tax=Metapenaeus joyneri majanivirus TaxID=2984280 RepID=A0A9C7EYR9_9VIRU|nr:MAG: hypothetical protein [Metapenaeus joyneri majanivirus]
MNTTLMTEKKVSATTTMLVNQPLKVVIPVKWLCANCYKPIRKLKPKEIENIGQTIYKKVQEQRLIEKKEQQQKEPQGETDRSNQERELETGMTDEEEEEVPPSSPLQGETDRPNQEMELEPEVTEDEEEEAAAPPPSSSSSSSPPPLQGETDRPNQEMELESEVTEEEAPPPLFQGGETDRPNQKRELETGLIENKEQQAQEETDKTNYHEIEVMKTVDYHEIEVTETVDRSPQNKNNNNHEMKVTKTVDRRPLQNIPLVDKVDKPIQKENLKDCEKEHQQHQKQSNLISQQNNIKMNTSAKEKVDLSHQNNSPSQRWTETHKEKDSIHQKYHLFNKKPYQRKRQWEWINSSWQPQPIYYHYHFNYFDPRAFEYFDRNPYYPYWSSWKKK